MVDLTSNRARPCWPQPELVQIYLVQHEIQDLQPIKREEVSGNRGAMEINFNDGEISWYTVFNNRFLVIISRSHAGNIEKATVTEEDLANFYKLIDTNLLNSTPN